MSVYSERSASGLHNETLSTCVTLLSDNESETYYRLQGTLPPHQIPLTVSSKPERNEVREPEAETSGKTDDSDSGHTGSLSTLCFWSLLALITVIVGLLFAGSVIFVLRGQSEVAVVKKSGSYGDRESDSDLLRLRQFREDLLLLSSGAVREPLGVSKSFLRGDSEVRKKGLIYFPKNMLQSPEFTVCKYFFISSRWTDFSDNGSVEKTAFGFIF